MKKLFTVGPQYHGHGSVIFAWQPGGSLIASVGEGQRNLFLFDRRGAQVDEVPLKSTARVAQLEWDRDGEVLAVLQQGEQNVLLWRPAERKLEVLEMNSKDPTWVSWSRTGAHLMIGTARGNLLIYNKRTTKKQTLMGKHTKRVTCGAWHHSESICACGSEDRTITVSNEEGDTELKSGDDPLRLKNEPSMVQFARPHSGGTDRLLSIVIGEASLLLCDLRNTAKPTELSFQVKYGAIKSYSWFGDSFLVIGFSLGYVIIISSQPQEMSEELSSVKYHANSLDCLCCSREADKIASAGDDGIRIIGYNGGRDFRELKSERIQVPSEARVTFMSYSDNGEILTFCTESGWVYCYLAKLTSLSATCNSRLAYLTSLREVTIREGATEQGSPTVVGTDVEPAFLALGPSHVATGMNNRIWFYSAAQAAPSRLVNEREYHGSVESVSLNATHACVLIEGRVYLHPIEHGDGKDFQFPRKEDERTITCATIVGNFLIYAQSNGRLQYFSLADQKDVNEYNHDHGIKRCYPNQEGTRAVIVDTSGQAWLYNPVNDDCVAIRDFPNATERVMWDTADSSILVACDKSNVYTYVYTQVGVGGSSVKCLGNVDLTSDGELHIEPAPMSLGHGLSAVLLVNGTLVCQQAGGQLSQQRLRAHEQLAGVGIPTADGLERQRVSFRQALGLNRFQLAFKIGLALNRPELWKAMGRRCLECLDIVWAKKAYRQAPEPGMVLYLERLQSVEDKLQLSGHVSALFSNFTKATDYFLKSCCPEAALDMHCDFQQWEQALTLAQTLAPHQLPEIFLKSALQCEGKGEHQQAQTHFEQAMRDVHPARKEHFTQCKAGLARTSLRLGDLNRGMQLAVELQSPAVCKDCASILKDMRQNAEAAQLFENAGEFDQAAWLYIKDKNFEAADPLMNKIRTPKLHLAYANAKETRGAYKDALVAYERAEDLDSVVRICLDKLNDSARAFRIVREKRIVSCARLVAEYCRKNSNICGAIEFLLLAKNDEEAYQLAERHDEMETFEQGIGEEGTHEQHMTIARYYEQRNLLSNAARHYALAEEYAIALKLYLKVGEKEIDNAIVVVGKAKMDALTHQLIDYLMGESDNIPKDHNYVYRLHKELGHYMQAAGTALIIAKQEQEIGNYKQAHTLLYRTYQDLRKQKLALPQELWRRLMILHSYVIVKRLVKIGDHTNAALMLLRVAKNIQQFPAHIVPILTSVVIECQRAKMTQEAYQYACMLMRPEHRPQVADQYKKKIENIVRKPAASEPGAGDAQAPCMYCGGNLGTAQLDCPMCQNISPFCIVSGMRMLKDDWTTCPSCNFPAKRTCFLEALATVEQCPMCDDAVKAEDLPIVNDPASLIAEYKSLFQTVEPI